MIVIVVVYKRNIHTTLFQYIIQKTNSGMKMNFLFVNYNDNEEYYTLQYQII